VKIPGFLARSFYVAGSLRNTGTGFQVQAQNPMGDGVLTGVRGLSVDGRAIDPSSVTAQREGDPQPLSARDVSAQNPVHFSKGDKVTLHVTGPQLSAGQHQLDVDLTELNLGQLSFSITDSLAG
jgi:hypothetical protein